MSSKVSVIMPVYNSEEYLGQAIESILNQTFRDFELLIINDGSTDNSMEIINQYCKKDNRIKVYSNESNKGLPYTRERALNLAHGEYIALMDADDISYKERLEIQVRYLDDFNDVFMVASNFDIIEEENIKKNIKIILKNNSILENNLLDYKMIFHNPIGNSTVMFRKSVIDKQKISYRKECFVAQDYAFWVDCKKNNKFKIINKALVAYRQGHNNVTKKSLGNRSIERKRVIDEIRNRAIKNSGLILNNNQSNIFNKIFSDPYQELETKDFYEFYNVVDKVSLQIGDIQRKKIFVNLAKYYSVRRLQYMEVSLLEKIKISMIRLKDESYYNYFKSLIRGIM